MEAIQRQGKGAMGKLTDDQLNVMDGKRTNFTGKLQEAYGIIKRRGRSAHQAR
jgi:uncharacterized protein YjbJ (UPF0337 family)